MYTREIDFFLNSFQQFLPFTFESALSTKVSNCWRTLASHSNPSLRSTCTSTSWCAWTPRGKKEGKRICVQQPPDLAVSRNSSAINDNRFKYQFSACIELRGECTPRGYGIPSIFRSSSFWGGIYQRCQASGQKGFVDKNDARAKLEIRCFWLRCGRKSIVDDGFDRIWYLEFFNKSWICASRKKMLKILFAWSNDQRRGCEKFSSSIPLKFSFLPRKRINAAKTSISSVISFKLLHTRFNFSFCSKNYFTFPLFRLSKLSSINAE